MPEELVVVIMAGMLGGIAWGVLNTIKTVMLKRYETQQSREGGALRQELAEITRRMEALEDNVVLRVQDLEERLDFAERVIAQSRRAGELPERN